MWRRLLPWHWIMLLHLCTLTMCWETDLGQFNLQLRLLPSSLSGLILLELRLLRMPLRSNILQFWKFLELIGMPLLVFITRVPRRREKSQIFWLRPLHMPMLRSDSRLQWRRSLWLRDLPMHMLTRGMWNRFNMESRRLQMYLFASSMPP